MISEWIIDKLEVLVGEPVVIIRDSLGLLPEAEGDVHRFARKNGFTALIASTNLSFRYIYEKAAASKDTKKLMIIDRAPARRRGHRSPIKAPPPFYPDLLSRTPETARIDINLRQFLVDKTGDSNWPQEVNDPRFARLIIGCLEGVVKAHGNLRNAHPTRFTDWDFKTIVAYSALGVPEAAFKLSEPKIYWRIALLGYPALDELRTLVPEAANSILKELRAAPAPFCWFADHPPELIVRAFYLTTIFSQHIEHWKILISSLEPELKPFCEIAPDLIGTAAPELVALDPERAHKDLLEIESSLSSKVLHTALIDELKIFSGKRFTEVIDKEHYSTLIRFFALLAALDDMLSDAPLTVSHEKLYVLLFTEPGDKRDIFVEQRPSPAWENLKEAYALARSIRKIQSVLDEALKALKVMKAVDLSFNWFLSLWNERRVNRLEYYQSALERLVFNRDFLPCAESGLPQDFLSAFKRIQGRMRPLGDDIQNALAVLNSRFQELIVEKYKVWLQNNSSEVRLTSQFLRRCVKNHWDSKMQKAVVFVFDGMRRDIWDELALPVFENRMEIIEDYPAMSLLPTETHISRKAIFAGEFPDSFDARSSEDRLLKAAMQKEFAYNGEIEVATPDGAGTGETVRYQAENIDFYIFELCDKALHNIQVKTLPDGRHVPARPLSFIYQQHIKDIIDNEVMAIIRNLPADTKVFVTADHGFGAIGRKPIGVEAAWLNETFDCSYLNARLRLSLKTAAAPRKTIENTLEFPIADLKLPASEEAFDRTTNHNWQKTFESVIFPKTGYALKRPKSRFKPDAYSHGGISIQEMLVPMVVLRVKTPEEGLLVLSEVQGTTELIEGEEAEFRINVQLMQPQKNKEIQVEAHAVYQNNENTQSIPHQIQYVSAAGNEIVFRFIPDPADASEKERRNGEMERTLRINVVYHEANRTVRMARTIKFTVRLNTEKIIRRVPANLGKILGLMPRSMKG